MLYSNPDDMVRCVTGMRTPYGGGQGAPTIRMALESIELLDEVVWFGGPKNASRQSET